MTDLELTRLCAEAMEYLVEREEIGGWHPNCGWYCRESGSQYGAPKPLFLFAPLIDDAQAMGLVKRFKLVVCPVYEDDIFSTWKVFKAWPEPETPDHWGDDLNRAIVECVAKLKGVKL